MPTLLHEQEVKLELRDMLERKPLQHVIDPVSGLIVPPARTPGLHLSGLLHYVAQTSRITARMQEISDERMPLRWMLGHAFEEMAASLCVEMVWQPGEVTEPVIMTCDGITYRQDLERASYCLNEFKCNRSKRFTGKDLIQKKWLWMCQGKGYALGYGTPYVEWNVLAVNEWPDPVWTRYLIEFDEKELADMARMIENNKEGAVRNGYSE